MKKTWLAAAAVLTLSMGGYAGAADLGVARRAPPPPPPAVHSWTGCYVGVGGGYGMADLDHSVTNAAGTQTFDTGHDNGGRGWLGTVGVGCDYQVAPRWLVGVAADWEWSNIRGTYSFNCPGGCAGPTGYSGTIRQSWAWSVGGRIGYLVRPRLLTFFSAGFTSARFDDVNYADAATGAATGLTLGAQTFNGYYLGGGTEYEFGFIPNLYWKSEYRFADYGSRNSNQNCGSAACGGAGTVNSVDRLHPYVHTLRSELVWRWGGGPVVARY